MNAEMTEKLSKYMMETGFYNTRQIRIDEGMSEHAARFMDIFGDDEDTIESKSEMLEAADAYNAAKISEIDEAQATAQDEILGALVLDWDKAIAAGMVEYSGEDGEGRPTNMYLRWDYSNRRMELLNIRWSQE